MTNTTTDTRFGKFIVFDGIDGAGKSTQIGTVVDFFQKRGEKIVVTREPGGTALGEALRELVLEAPVPIHLETEALLMFAARREHLERVIWPALQAGVHVLSDRFTDATYAYQGGGRGLEADRIALLENWVQRDFRPDLTVIFDIPIEQAKARWRPARIADRFEREGDEFFDRVCRAYRDRAASDRGHYEILDSSTPVDEVRIELIKRLRKHFS